MGILLIHIGLAIAVCVFRWLFKRRIDKIKREFLGEHVFMTEISADRLFVPLIACQFIPCIAMGDTLLWIFSFLIIVICDVCALNYYMENFPLLVFYIDTDEVEVITDFCFCRSKYKTQELTRRTYTRRDRRYHAIHYTRLYYKGRYICEWRDSFLYANESELLKQLERIPQE